MKKRTLNIALLALFAIFAICFTSCSKVKVGYLRTTGASFTPDSMIVVRNLDTHKRPLYQQNSMGFYTYSGRSWNQSIEL